MIDKRDEGDVIERVLIGIAIILNVLLVIMAVIYLS